MGAPAKIVSIDPKDVEIGKPGGGAVPINPDDVDSVMDPASQTASAKIKRLGKALAAPAAGTATAIGGSILGGAVGNVPGAIIGAGIGGGLAPVAETAAARATGQPASMPSAKEVLKSAALNMAGEGIGQYLKGAEAFSRFEQAGKSIEQLPAELRTVKNLKQAVRNDDFLKSLGMNPDQIAEARANPSGVEATLRDSIDRQARIKDNFQNIVDSTRESFKKRYDDAFSIPESGSHSRTTVTINGVSKTIETGGKRSLSEVPVDATPLQQSFAQTAAKGGQHELTPSFRSFLDRKAGELASGGDRPVRDPFAPMDAKNPKTLDPNDPNAKTLIDKMRSQGLIPERKAMTVQDLRDLRSELRENVPSNPTPLDQKAAQQLNQQITQQYEKTLRDAGASSEQIGRLHGIDDDYARFRETLKTLDPRDERFGQKAANAIFTESIKNPEQAVNLVKMAKDAGRLPEFREQFLQNVAAKGVAAGGPQDEMKVYRALQDQWRSTDAGKAVLTEVFGKDSPMANPTTMSKVLGALSTPETADKMGRTARTVTNIGFQLRSLVYLAAAGGSIYSIANHPDRWPAAIAAMGTLAVAPTILSRVNPMVQRAFVKVLAEPDSAIALGNLSRAAGATITGLEAQPQ